MVVGEPKRDVPNTSAQGVRQDAGNADLKEGK